MPTKISNTNTNINKININVPRRYTPRPTKKNVAKAEQELSQVENLDREIPYISQAPSQFINPSVFGFNTTPIQEPVRPRTVSRGTQTEPMETQTEPDEGISPQTVYAEPLTSSSDFMPQRGDTPRSPMPFRSSQAPERRDALTLGYSQPNYKLNMPSDFPSRLSQAEGSAFPSSGSSFKMPISTNRMRDIQKQGRTDLDINEMARNVKEAYRSTPQEEKEIPFAKSAGTSPRAFGDESFGVSPSAVVDEPLEVVVPPAKKGKGGRPVGSKNKPKPISEETQTGPSLPNTPKPKKVKTGKPISVPVGVSTPKFEQSIETAGGGLRGAKSVAFAEPED